MKLVLEEDNVKKAFGLPEGIDPNHVYVYRSGEHGIYEFWYEDNFGNFWQYTNAPKDHKDYDPYGGEAILVTDQPMPHTAPQFYSEEGLKLHAAVPQGANLVQNEAYDPLNPRSIWYSMYQDESGETRFLYLDMDVRKNLDLWIQYQLRVSDSMLVRYRKYATKLFASPHPKDRTIAVILMLVDQGVYEPYELITAKVEDLEYIDFTIKLRGRKMVCDPGLVDFFTSITADRDPSEPLFVLDTHMGRKPVGIRMFYSILRGLKVSPHFLLYWHISHLYSRVVHRMAAENIPAEEVEDRAENEVARALGIGENISQFIDYQLKTILRMNYRPLNEPPAPPSAQATAQEDMQAPQGEAMNKGLAKLNSDDLGVLQIWSDLEAKRPDELEFSKWLHGTPMHDVSDEELVDLSAQAAEQAAPEGEVPPAEGDEGAVAGNETPDQAAGGTGGAA